MQGGVVIATSKQAYRSLEAGIIDARRALEALDQGNDQIFEEIFSQKAPIAHGPVRELQPQILALSHKA